MWLPDGRLEVTGYGTVEEPDDGWRTIIDVATGTTEEVPRAEIPQQAPSVDTQGPNGERIDSNTENGQLRVTLTDDSETRELLSVGAPTTYTLGDRRPPTSRCCSPLNEIPSARRVAQAAYRQRGGNQDVRPCHLDTYGRMMKVQANPKGGPP